MKTAFIVQSFTRQGSGKDSKIFSDPPIQCNTLEEAINRAERFSEIRSGVIAISQKYDEDTGDYGELKILAKHGEIPEGVIAGE